MLVVDVELDGVGGGEQLLVIEQNVAVQVGGDVTLAVVHHHEVLQALERRQQRSEEPEQRAVDEDHLVVGVIDDVGELLGEQPDVERVQDSTGTRRGEVQLEVTGGVPRERADATVGGDPEVVEHAAELAGARCPLTVGGAFETGAGCRDDLLVRVVLLRPFEDVRDGERNVLHQALHEGERSAHRHPSIHRGRYRCAG